MKSSFDSGLASAPHIGRPAAERGELMPRARERDERDEDDGELWALAVTDLLVQRLPPLPRADGEAEPAAPARNAGASSAAPPGGSGVVAPPGARDESHLGSAGEGAGVGATRGRSDGAEVPSELSAEVSDERFGRLQLHIARGQSGLDIVINVADSHVKALIEAEHAILIKTLKDAGLRVSSVQIGSSAQPGTALALDRGGAERARAGAALKRPNARRAYPSPREEGDDPNSEGVDFTA